MKSGEGFERIVVAFDGSKDSLKAVRLAGSLAAKYGSRVTVVHVYSSPVAVYAAGPGMPMPDYKSLEEAAEGSGQKILERGVQAASEAGIKAKGELLEAPSVVEAIVDYASNQKADLIIVGTRGMTGFRRLILGSVSSGLISHSHCPVLVAR